MSFFFLIVRESMKEYHKKGVTLKSKEKSLFFPYGKYYNDFYNKRLWERLKRDLKLKFNNRYIKMKQRLIHSICPHSRLEECLNHFTDFGKCS